MASVVDKYNLKICESMSEDGKWHVCHTASTVTRCGKLAREAPQTVKQGPSALLILKGDVGACDKCRKTLNRLFSESGAN